MRFLLPLTLLVLVACKQDAPPPVEVRLPQSPSPVSGALVGDTQFVIARLEQAIVQQQAYIQASATRHAVAPEDYRSPRDSLNRIDTRSPERFVESLQRLERELDPDFFEGLQDALMVMQLYGQQRIVEMVGQASTPPEYTDEELLQIFFGSLHGLSAFDVILAAGEVAPHIQ